MEGIFLIVKNEKEGRILQEALKQCNVKVTWSEPNFGNYIKAAQYKPNFILIEIGETKNEMKIVNLISRNKRLKRIPMVGYGNYTKSTADRHFVPGGLVRFFSRPIKFSSLIQVMCKSIKGFDTVLKEKKVSPSQETISENQLLLNKSVKFKEKLDTMTGKVFNVLAFPFTVAKIIQMTADESSSARSLSTAIESDPVIAASVLKFSNTIFYASRDRKISKINEAIVRIGFQETKNIVLSLSVMKLFNEKHKSFGFDRLDFWFHSLAVGLIAEKFLSKVAPNLAGKAFMAGLMHDFGIIILDEFFEDIFAEVMEDTVENGTNFVDNVMQTIGISHNVVCEHLFEMWRLPYEFGYCAKHQNNFQTHRNIQDPSLALLARAIGAANIIAKSLLLGNECDRWAVPIEDHFMDEFKLKIGISEDFKDFIYHRLNVYGTFMGLKDKKYPPEDSEMDNPEKLNIAFINLPNHLFSPYEHYLKTQKYNLESFNFIEKLKKSEKKFEFLVVQTSKKTTAEELNNIIKVFWNKRSSEAPKNCMIILCYPDSKLLKSKSSPNISMLPNNMDLRQMDAIISFARQPEIDEEVKETPITYTSEDMVEK